MILRKFHFRFQDKRFSDIVAALKLDKRSVTSSSEEIDVTDDVYELTNSTQLRTTEV